MVSNLTVIKHNHSKSKYPTHKSGITWQPRVHLPTPVTELESGTLTNKAMCLMPHFNIHHLISKK